jgi:hypothetical protein
MAAVDDLKALDELIADPNVRAGSTGRYKNKSYTLAQLVTERAKVAKQVEQEETAATTARTTAAREAAAEAKTAKATQEELNREIRMARGELEAAQGNLNIAIDRGGDVAGAQKVLGEAFRKLQQLNPQDKMLEGVSVPTVSRGGAAREGGMEASTAPIMGAADIRAKEQAALNQQTDPDSVRVVSTKTIERNGYTIKVETMSDGAVKETTLGKVGEVTPTPTGGGTGGTKTGKAKTGTDTVTAQAATDWEATFRQTFPSRAWILDEVDRTKYPQLFTLLKKAHDEKYYTTPEGQQRFLAELEAVDYYKELAVSGKVRDIKAVVGDLGFESTDFGRFVNQAINFGWSGDRLKQETYKEVFRRNPDGTYANPTAVTRTTKGADYLSVGNIAKAYFNTASDAGIESVLTGSITNEDFARQQREIAKTRYGHLSNLIDQGVTLEDLSASYKSAAAKLLELDLNTIDMSEAQYEVALAYGGENGQKRTMTTGEWERLLRTDSRYGWEKTENAKDEARSLATTIAQAFGRIL